MKWYILLVAFFLHYQYNAGDDEYIRKKRIVGGYFSSEGLFPYIVSLRLFKYEVFIHFCGGAIISTRYVLSSAHCLLLEDETESYCLQGNYIAAKKMNYKIIAVVGTNELDNDTGDVYNIESYISHSEFNFKLGINDISLLRTSKIIEYTKIIQPIGFYLEEVPVGSVVVVSGWGLTTFPGEPSNELKFIDLKTISYEECAKSWKRVYPSQICTLTQVGEGVCSSDSGGPLIYKGKLVGLVSFGKPCAVGFPDVFTNVSFLIDWIVFNTHCISDPDLLGTLPLKF